MKKAGDWVANDSTELNYDELKKAMAEWRDSLNNSEEAERAYNRVMEIIEQDSVSGDVEIIYETMKELQND
jgi:hypothetical protein